MDAASIKRMILENSDSSGIRKRASAPDTGISTDERIHIADCLERMTKTEGWIYTDAYINKVIAIKMGELLASEKDDPYTKGFIRGMSLPLQYIDQMIKAGNELKDAE
jgi:uncharacterized protein YjhX (UPF0386 family)